MCLCLCALQALKRDLHTRLDGKGLLEKLACPFAVARLQKNRAKVAGYGGIARMYFRVKIHGFYQIGLGLKKICALGKGHAYIIIERGIVGRDLDGALVLGDGVLPAALPAQADAKLVEKGQIAPAKAFAPGFKAAAQEFFGHLRGAFAINACNAA